ncbi:uncharacterized protein [Anabrus simplex]|uniref:uncharacterized protein n=1 Tax=Anabrus simplex TaxID=316456 RepID=UPI0034DCDEBF
MERQSTIKFEAVWLPEEEAAEQAKQDGADKSGRVDDSFLQKRYGSVAPTPVLVPPLPSRLAERERPPSKNNCPSRPRKRKVVCECATRRKQMCSEYDALKVELLKTEIYFRKLQALKLEKELGLLPSEFTERIYHQGSDEETMSAPSPIIFPDDL